MNVNIHKTMSNSRVLYSNINPARVTNINIVTIFTLQYKNKTILVYFAAGIQVPTKVTTALSSNDDTGDDVVTVMMSLCKVTTALSSSDDTGGDVVTVMMRLCKVTTALSSNDDTGGDVVTVVMSLWMMKATLTSSPTMRVK
jgi:hypothetical protein